MLKSLLGNPLAQFLIGRTIGLYMLLVGNTTRWRRVNHAAVEPYLRGHGRLVACIWRGRFLLFFKLWSYGAGATQGKMLISRSRDGGIVTQAAHTVGSDVIRGSAAKGDQQKGGFEAGRELLRHIESGGTIGMTPDGPRGPRMRARIGPVQVARLAQAPILCVAWSTRWRLVFKSWDKFILPLPFGPGALVWGEPIQPPAPGADAVAMEACRLQVENELNRVTNEADRIAGVAKTEPAHARGAATPAPAATAK